MSPLDGLRYAAGSVRGHALRTTLSVLGVAIGVSSVMVLTSLGEGARAYITGEFMSLGSNLLIVVPGKTETEKEAPIISQAPHDLTLQDADAIARRSPYARRVAPLLLGNAAVGFGDRRRVVNVIGTTGEMLRIRRLEMMIGRFLPEGNLDRGARVGVIGSKIESELFGGENPLGAVLRVGDERYKVIGVMAPKGTSLGFDMDDLVQIPVSSAMALFNKTTLFRIMIEVRSRDELEPAVADVKHILEERHDDVEDFTIIRQDSLVSAFGQILRALTAALAAIAAISLGVAGIGIMNVMLVSVSERTGEIGLLKALGAENRQILMAFITEASLLSSLGGVVGVIGGYALTGLVRSLWPVLPAHVPSWAVVSAVVVAVGVGLAFGALPARRAARMDPILALARGKR